LAATHHRSNPRCAPQAQRRGDARRSKQTGSKIKAIELEAERLQQEALYSHSRSAPLGSEAAPAVAARANLAAYEQVLAVRFPKAPLDRLGSAFDAVKFEEFVAR